MFLSKVPQLVQILVDIVGVFVSTSCKFQFYIFAISFKYVMFSGGHRRSAEPKQVMFSDGIRPGGDLTELDGSAEVTRMPPRRSRVQKKVERHSQGLCLEQLP